MDKGYVCVCTPKLHAMNAQKLWKSLDKFLTKFLTGGKQTTRSTSLQGRARPVAVDPNTFNLDLGHRTCIAWVTLSTAVLIDGFRNKFSAATFCQDKNNVQRRCKTTNPETSEVLDYSQTWRYLFAKSFYFFVKNTVKPWNGQLQRGVWVEQYRSLHRQCNIWL